MDRTLEVASPDWLAAMAATIRQEMAGLDLQGESFTVAEEFTDVPAHLADEGTRSFKWHARISGDRVEVDQGIPDDADLITAMSYDTALRLAKLVYGDDPVATAEKDRIINDAIKAGKMAVVRRTAPLPAPLSERFGRVHDAMARRTL